jgi:hypothetical protein
MGFLRKRGPRPAEVTQFSGLQIQSSSNAVPIAICYGINKVAGNLLWYGNFQALPEYSKNGGKGGGRQTLTGYNYTTAFVLGLCEGPIEAVGKVWKDQGVYYPAYLAIGVASGSSTQGPSGVVSAYGPSQALAYRGLAYAESYIYFLGSTATIGNLQFEIYGRKYQTAFVNGYDSDPAEVIYDFLTSAQYGVGFPPESIDATTLFGVSGGSSYQAYCWAHGIGISPVLANRESANSTLKRWLQLTNSEAVWSGGKLKFIPYGDSVVEGEWVDHTPVSFSPNVMPIYDLSDDDFVGGSDEDPVLVERKDEAAIFNVQQLEFSDRVTGYNSSTITVWDQNSIEEFRRRDGSTVTAHEICDRKIAQTVAQLILQREVYIRNSYTFKLSFEYCLLEPMDIVLLTDTALGLVAVPVRILSIEEDDDGLLTVTAEEFPGGTGSAVAYPVQGNEASVLDRNVVASAVTHPVIFEPPSGLTGGERQIWLAASGGLAMVWRLEEDSSGDMHVVSATLGSQALGSVVVFSAYVLAGERNFCRFSIHDGVAVQSVSFDLLIGASSEATAGIMASSIAPVSVGSWYFVEVTCGMAATAAPVVSIALENPMGTISYVGAAGDGLFVWNPQFGSAVGSPLIIATLMVASGATFDPDAQDPPPGFEGTADPYWGGCIIHVSTDDATYGQIGQINGPARLGKVVGDTGTVISVNLVESGATLDAASVTDAQNEVTLSLVGDELLAYGGAALIGPNAYDLANLVRGLYNTISWTHIAGDRFVRLDDAVFKYAFPAGYVGRMLYLKFQSFNIFGQAFQELSTCATYTYVPSGVGAGLGLIMEQLALGADADLGRVTDTVTIEEDLSILSYAPGNTVDLGALA